MGDLNINPRTFNQHKNVSKTQQTQQTQPGLLSNTGQIIDVKPVDGGNIMNTAVLNDKINANAAVTGGAAAVANEPSLMSFAISVGLFILLALVLFKIYKYWFPEGIFPMPNKEKVNTEFKQKTAQFSNKELEDMAKLADSQHQPAQHTPQHTPQPSNSQSPDTPQTHNTPHKKTQQPEKEQAQSQQPEYNNSSENTTDEDVMKLIEEKTGVSAQQPTTPTQSTNTTNEEKKFNIKKGDLILYERDDTDLTKPVEVYGSMKEFLKARPEAEETQVNTALKNGTFYMGYKFILQV